jgi:NitT/TauT family transport system ATP-binding protein
MMVLFERLNATRACATLIVTHVTAEAARLATRVLRLDGRPARLVADRKAGAYFQLPASGVATSRS